MKLNMRPILAAVAALMLLVAFMSPVLAEDSANTGSQTSSSKVGAPADSTTNLAVYKAIPSPITDPNWKFVGKEMDKLKKIVLSSCDETTQSMMTGWAQGSNSAEEAAADFATSAWFPTMGYKVEQDRFDTMIKDASKNGPAPAWVPAHAPTFLEMSELLADHGCFVWYEATFGA